MERAADLQLIGALQFGLLAFAVYVLVQQVQDGRLHAQQQTTENSIVSR